MRTRTNPTCAQCKYAHTGINGRICDKLGKTVEYAKEPLCKTAKK